MKKFIWNNRYTVGLVVFVLCLVGGLQVYHENQIHEVKVAAKIVCETGNTLRDTLNKRGAISKAFFAKAAETRRKSAEAAKKRGDMEQYRIDHEAQLSYRASADAYKRIPLINCNASYRAGRTIYEPVDSKTLNPAGKSKPDGS